MSKTASLALAVADPTSATDQPQATHSPTSPRTSTSLSTSPGSPAQDLFKLHNIGSNTADSMEIFKKLHRKGPQVPENAPPSPTFTSLPQFPPSPTTTPTHGRDQGRSMLSNLRAAMSSSDLNNTPFDGSSMDTPDGTSKPEHMISRRPVGTPTRSDSAVMSNKTSDLAAKKSKPRFGNFLNRTHSTPLDDGEAGRNANSKTGTADAPAERLDYSHDPIDGHTSSPGLAVSASGVFREGAGSAFLTSLKKSSSKAADGLGKAGKFISKIGRSGSSNSKDPAEDVEYVCKIIRLPLLEQSRRTRIAKRLEDSKDKTEFWMPALPWRCIDFLNDKGCEEEGLYRIPGSGPRIKEWERRFDQERDIDLFNEPELYDVNIIGSMFKGWLREIPDEIFPKATQARIARECKGSVEVPQMLKDELSKLPPWNYYLLFATTCHLSLLHAYVGQNRMTFHNLCVCFQPCLKIDAFCFKFLVCDWKDCWQGCWTEDQALLEEYRVMHNLDSRGGGSSDGSTAVAEELSVSSSENSKPTLSGRAHDRPRLPPLILTSASGENLASPARNGDSHHRDESQLPELAPVVPMSPIGI